MSDNHQTTTLILAGGKGRRLNGLDKGLVKLADKHLIDYSRDLAPTDSTIVASVNRNIAQYKSLGYECISDGNEAYAGPMVAIWQAAKNINTPYLLVLPCDTPLLPSDIATRLLAPVISGQQSASYASHNNRGHYCCMAARLEAFDAITNTPRSMRSLLDQLNAQAIEITSSPHTFLNVNTEQDLVLAERYL